MLARALALAMLVAALAPATALEHRRLARAEPVADHGAWVGKMSANAHIDEAKLHQWVDLTRELYKDGDLPNFHQLQNSTGQQVSILRQILNDWNANLGQHPQSLFLRGAKPYTCAETGDGHFLKDYFSSICQKSLSLDAFDERADVKLDLNLPPKDASPDVKKSAGKVDLLLSHQVFEHLKKPTIGLANLNAMLKTGGTLLFTVPFTIQDHQFPGDYFRYTARNVNDMLTCAGFTVKTLQGHGSLFTTLTYLADVPSDWLSAEERSPVMDCLDKAANFCANRRYMMVEAVATKNKDLSEEEEKACFM